MENTPATNIPIILQIYVDLDQIELIVEENTPKYILRTSKFWDKINSYLPTNTNINNFKSRYNQKIYEKSANITQYYTDLINEKDSNLINEKQSNLKENFHLLVYEDLVLPIHVSMLSEINTSEVLSESPYCLFYMVN